MLSPIHPAQVNLGSYPIPREVIQIIISYSKPSEILSVWALISKNFYQLTMAPNLWELVFKGCFSFRQRRVTDLTIYKRLCHLGKKNYYKDVSYLSFRLPEGCKTLGILGEYFLFQKSSGHIAYCPFMTVIAQESEVETSLTLSDLSEDSQIIHASCSDDHLWICYSDGRLVVVNRIEDGVKLTFQISNLEILHSKIYSVGTHIYFINSSCMYWYNSSGKGGKTFFIHGSNFLKVYTCSLDDSIDKVPDGQCAVSISMIAKFDEKTLVIGTNMGQIFLWNIHKNHTDDLLCDTRGYIQRIDCDTDHNPHYIVICTEKIICINVNTMQWISIDLQGHKVLSITFQKNAFFVGNWKNCLYKCDVFSPIPILIYKGMENHSRLTFFSQVWDGLRLFFSTDREALKAIDFSERK